MKKILLILLVFISFLSAEINEYVSDVYFANGIDTDEDTAKKSRDKLAKKFKLSNPEAYKSIANWKVSYNTTHGIGIDLYESMLQKIDEDWKIKYALKFSGLLKFTYGGIAKMAIKKVAKKQINAFAAKQAEKLARQIFVEYSKSSTTLAGLTKSGIEYMFNEIFKKIINKLILKVVNIPEEDIKKREQEDVKTQFAAYVNSIKSGHGVIVVAHSQGNLFTNIVYDKFKNHWLPWDEDTEWMRTYFRAIGIATPANDILGKQSPYMTFDNDIIGIIPNSLKSNVTNPKRYYFKNALEEKVDNIFSLEAHSFLTSYMATDITRDAILGYIEQEVRSHEKKPSQWKIKDDTASCQKINISTCSKKRVSVTHTIDSKSMDGILNGSLVYPFSEEGGKLYTVDNKYVIASFGGETFLEKPEEGICYKIPETDETIEGDTSTEDTNMTIPKIVNGALDIRLSWDYEQDIDMDLTMTGPRNVVKYDIKDIDNVGLEHAYVETAYQMQFGDVYKISAKGNKVPNSKLEESCLVDDPVHIYAVLGTPQGLYFEQYEAKSFKQLDLDIAEIRIRDKIETIWKCPALRKNPDPDWYNKWNGDTNSFQCLKCRKPYEVKWKAKTYADSVQCNKELKIWEDVTVLVSDSRYYCNQPSNNSCPVFSPSVYSLYNDDTNKYDCLQCSDENAIKWHAPRYEEYESTCGTDVRIFKHKIDGRWSCDIKPERVYVESECTDEKKKSTCGCVPCEYIVKGMRNVLEYGPIVGAKVQIVEAKAYNKPDAFVVYKGETSRNDDIYKAGIITLSAKDKEKFKDETYYVLSAKGGSDIDRDDNFIRDDNPTVNHGTIHAIIKGSDIKAMSFRVNVLTEAVFQVSGGVIGDEYNATLLERNLDEAARKLLNTKLYPTDVNQEIVYRDVLLWTPAVDKKVLYKPYDTFVEPIVLKTYSDSIRVDESYRLIYEPYDSDAPLLEPKSLKITEGLPNKTPIGKVVVQNDKHFVLVELKGKYADYFSVSTEGMLFVEKSSLIRNGHHYRLKMRAVDTLGRKGSFVGLTIDVEQGQYQVNAEASVPILESFKTYEIDENAVEGTLVATTHFTDSNQTIVGYRLTGESAKKFVVDTQGVVTVASGADIDYEAFTNYHFLISAYNDVGNASYPLSLSIMVKNVIDTPLYPLVFFTHVEENIAIGTKIGKLVNLREGKGEIEHFDILSPNIPFVIDKNGTVTVSKHIDFEQDKEFQFLAIAYTKYGQSNKIKCTVIIDNQEPEEGLPTLEALNLSIDENISNGSKIGQLLLAAGATPIERIILYGDNENFRIDNNGNIYVADDATLDYEIETRYVLGARALNSRGFGNEIRIRIEVNNIADELPTIAKFSANIEENATVGTYIGKLIFLGEDSELEIETLTLNGKGYENFRIEKNGMIYLSNVADINYEKQTRYWLHAVLTGGGYSATSDVTIQISNVVEHVPVLKASTFHVEENENFHIVVGRVEEEVGGDSPIVSYALDNNSTFSIDKAGFIRVNAPLDYETKNRYTLAVTATNSMGESNPVTIVVNIEDVVDVVPKIKPLHVSIYNNMKSAKVIGKIEILSSGDSDIRSMMLTGIDHEKFEIDRYGAVRLVENASTYAGEYTLSARAFNEAGQSLSVEVRIITQDIIGDTVKPTLMLLGSVNIVILLDEDYTEYGAKAEDNEDGDISHRIVITSDIDTHTEGNYTVTYNVSDYNGNMAEPIKRNVTVKNIRKKAILKTGQTTSYAAHDDGDYQKGVERGYSRDNVKEVVVDHTTGLMWQDNSEAKTVTKLWVTEANYYAGKYNDTSGDTATTYCTNLTLGGYEDWRLPTRKELINIVDWGRINPSLDPEFLNVASYYYWSSTTYAYDSRFEWSVRYYYNSQFLKSFKIYNLCVRCVRAGE